MIYRYYPVRMINAVCDRLNEQYKRERQEDFLRDTLWINQSVQTMFSEMSIVDLTDFLMAFLPFPLRVAVRFNLLSRKWLERIAWFVFFRDIDGINFQYDANSGRLPRRLPE